MALISIRADAKFRKVGYASNMKRTYSVRTPCLSYYYIIGSELPAVAKATRLAAC